MPRSKRLPEVERSMTLNIRLRRWEYDTFQAAAADAAETVSEYVRRLVLTDASTRLTPKARGTDAAE